MTDIAWIDNALTSARPQAIGALLRYFRDLDTAEEAFQEACLRALKTWPQNGPPRDAAAWLIMVGRNVAIDSVRRERKQEALPEEDAISDLGDAESELAERLDGQHYRDDILRLLFICCHPDLPATQQIALALRVVSGLTVKQIARAFLVSESAMEQRITRAKARVADAERAVRDARRGRARRAARRGRRDDLPRSSTRAIRPTAARRRRARRCATRRSASRACCCACFPTEPEIMGLTALLLLQNARAPGALRRARARSCCSRTRTARCWDRPMIAEGLALIDKAVRHRRRGPYQVQAAIAAMHARAAKAEDTDWAQIDLLYAALEADPAVAGRHAQPRGRGLQGARRRGRAGDDRAARQAALRLFLLLRRQGRPADAARPQRGSPRRLRSRHRARRYGGRSRAHPHASRSPDEAGDAGSRRQGRDY